MNKNKPTVLIVDDELSIRESFSLILEESYTPLLAASGEAALKKIVDEKVDLVYLDIRMPGMDGLETLKRMKEIDSSIEIIMVTAVNDVQKASEAVKLGARDYVVKPFDVPVILTMTKKTLGAKELTKEGRKAQAKAIRRGIPEIIGNSPRIEEVARIIENISKKDVAVLFVGEPGVEIELLSRIIHEKSSRASAPFKVINIEKEPVEFIRSKIFGSERGTSIFTLSKEKGILEEGAGGTLLIKNIENLDARLQEELAKVLETKEIKKEGSYLPISLNIRVISATSQNLKELTVKGKFSKALYELISEAYIEIPSLRERITDISVFISYFLEKYNMKYNKRIKGFSKDALEILSGYTWPKNVEELRVLIENLVLTTEEEYITVDQLPIDILLHSTAFFGTDEKKRVTLEALWTRLEKDYIRDTLEKVNFDEAKAGIILGLKPVALKAKLESLGLSKR